MFGFAAFDVLIGLVTIYLVFALSCTAIVEAISSWMNLRSKNLEAALKEFLDGDLEANKSFVDAFYAHPLVNALSKGADGRPSYIPTDIVGRVIQSLLLKNDPDTSLAKAIESLPDVVTAGQGSAVTAQATRVKELFRTFVAQGERDLLTFRKAVETQFDAIMDRASGWVKRRQQTVALIVSAVLVLCANVDTFAIATALYTSPELRDGLIAQAKQLVDKDTAATAEAVDTGGKTEAPAKPLNTSPGTTSKEEKPLAIERQKLTEAVDAYNRARTTMMETGLQFGWKSVPSCPRDIIAKLFGLLISIFAIALGAPFWFDVLNRFMKVRHSGVSPMEKKAEPAKAK